MALVVDRPAAIGHRRAVLGGDRPGLLEQLVARWLAGEQLLGAREVDGGQADGAQRDPGPGDVGAVEPERGAGRGDRPIARSPLDLLVRGAGAGAFLEADLGE